MKKNYFSTLFAALMLFVAMPATAQVNAMSDLFGKWQFAATVTTTEAGAAHADKFKSECEVTIGKAESEYFMADIANFAGADYAMSVSGFNASTYTIEINGPNSANYGIWEGYIAVANAAGEWPFSLWDVEGSVQYGMHMTVDPETKEITIPDFTIVSLDWQTYTPTVLATVTNAKMTVIELDVKDTSNYPDLTGLWTWEGGLRTDTVSLQGFTVEFEMVDNQKDNWKATFTFGDYEPFTLDATFDGELVTIPHDTTYLDKEEGIRFGTRSSATEGKSEFMFSYNSKTSMSLYNYIYVRKDVYSGDTLKGGKIYQVFDGYITRKNPDAYDWSGTYKVSVAEFEDLVEADTVSFPAEFDMVVEKRPGDLYEVTEFLGYKDLYFSFTPADDDKSAEISLGGYSGAILQSFGQVGEGDNVDYAYHVVTDANAEPTTLTLTMNEDGTFSFADFSVSYKLYYAGTYEPIAAFYGAKATKEVFDWAGEYTLTATVEEFDTTKCASEFDVKIEKFNDTYYITQFDGDKVYSLNYGGIEVEVTGNNTAKIASGCFVNGSYPVYITLDGVDDAAIEMTMDNAGNINMADFLFHPFNYDTFAAGNPIAKYTNVVLTRKAGDAGIENMVTVNKTVEGIFDLLGRKLDVITAPGIYIVNGKKVVVK
jgi:hypothetical protein